MGKPTGKKKKADPSKRHDAQSKPAKGLDRASKAFDEDTAVFITMSQELKEEGSKLFQKRDHEGAMLKYEKALKLLPKNHIDVANLRTNMATCYMQVGIGEYTRAINECNLALEVAPKYSKALLKRAKCFEAVNRLDLAWRDVRLVLSMEPSNTNALEIADSVKRGMEEKGIKVEEIEIGLSSKDVESVGSSGSRKVRKENRVGRENSSSSKKKKKGVRIEVTKHVEERKVEDRLNPKDKENQVEDRLNAHEYKSKPEDKEVVKEKIHVKEDKGVTRTAKLVFGDDIRWAQLPSNCSMLLIRDIVRDRFPNLKGALIKCRDQEGDLITITTVEELRRAEASCNPQGSLRLYIAEVDPDQEPVYDCCEEIEIPVAEKRRNRDVKYEEAGKDGEMEAGSTCVENWILHFAQLFKSHVGFDSDSYLELHDTGMKLYSEAVEDTLTSEEAQELFDMASEKFQEMAALALFNWGNVHMSKARKWVPVSEENANESMVTHIESAYEWAQNEYKKAQTRYQEALKIKPDFYEGHLALGQQQFEQARVCWHYSLGKKIDLEVDSYQDVIELYNKAEDNMEAGVHIWEEMEERRLNGLSKEDKYKTQLQKMGLDGLLNDIPADEASEKAAIMRSQIYILWGKLLYERSIVEFKLGLPTWEECLEVAVENFELAGASHTDIAVMIKNHCANQTTQEGLGFKIDEIVQAWHEMYDAKRWQTGVLSFRLEPLFRRRVPILHNILEHTRLC